MNERTYPRWWYGLGLLAVLSALIMIMCSGPGRAEAGWFDFIGDAAVAVSDATWKVMLIKAVERSLPTLLLGIVVVGAIACAVGAGALAMRLHDSARTAMRDDRVNVGEWIILGVLASITLPTAVGLMWFASFLARAARSGLLELMR